ncbi:MAG: FtsW/RodA/SpoVE family cell cycle protein, partial [Acidimicrobiia bacterium]|nr:FtsW/RodA/SpoVE family cell cycle protein [Acidimicrobiia bacterium]
MTILSPTAPSGEAQTTGGGAPDVVLMVATLALMALGVLMVYSASRDAQLVLSGDETRLMTRQVYFVLAGLVMFGVLSIIDYREFQHYSPLVYGATILLLVLVFFQPARSGASRWIILPGGFQLQPSEFAKVAMILLIAAVLARSDSDRLSWRVLGQALGVLAVPALLIVAQPDLGTSLVFAFLTIVVLFAGDA